MQGRRGGLLDEIEKQIVNYSVMLILTLPGLERRSVDSRCINAGAVTRRNGFV